MLVVGRRRNRIAIAAVGQHVDPWTVAQSLAVGRGVGLPIAVRQRKLTGAQAVVDLAPGDETAGGRADRDPLTVARAEPRKVARTDQQGAVRIVAPPGRIAENLVGIEHSPLSCSEYERIVRRQARNSRVKLAEPFQQWRDGEPDLAIRMADQRPYFVVVVRRDRRTAAGRDNGVEQRVAKLIVA